MSSELSGEISDRQGHTFKVRGQSVYSQSRNSLVTLLRISDLKSAWSQEISIYLALSVAILAVFAPFDETFTRMIKASDSLVKRVMAGSSDIGLSQIYLIPSAIILLSCVIIHRTSKYQTVRERASHYYYQAFHVFVSVAVSGLLVDLLKICIGRARPKLIDVQGAWYFSPWSVGYDFASMPSGHAATVGAVVAVLMIWLPKWRPLILAIGFVAAATRFAVAAHYVSDVLAGFTIGYVYSLWLGRWLAIGNLGLKLKQGSIYPSAKLRLGSSA
jgi:membrane-associated phospholipid phosphatase